jgi:hypothetical protein
MGELSFESRCRADTRSDVPGEVALAETDGVLKHLFASASPNPGLRLRLLGLVLLQL